MKVRGQSQPVAKGTGRQDMSFSSERNTFRLPKLNADSTSPYGFGKFHMDVLAVLLATKIISVLANRCYLQKESFVQIFSLWF